LQVAQQVGVVAAGVLQGVGQHGETGGVQFAGGQGAMLVGGLDQRQQVGCEPAGVEGDDVERVAEQVAEQVSLCPVFGLLIVPRLMCPLGGVSRVPGRGPHGPGGPQVLVVHPFADDLRKLLLKGQEDVIRLRFSLDALNKYPGLLRTVSFAKGEDDAGLDVAEPVVVEGVLCVIRHSVRGEFLAVVELQVREARRVR
jgi:hypothetical protein